MKNVQLLVVDRASLEQGKPRLCGVAEQGEIFVRAGGKLDIVQRLTPTKQRGIQVSPRDIWDLKI